MTYILNMLYWSECSYCSKYSVSLLLNVLYLSSRMPAVAPRNIGALLRSAAGTALTASVRQCSKDRPARLGSPV